MRPDRPLITLACLLVILVSSRSEALSQATELAVYRLQTEEFPTPLSPYAAYREVVSREESGGRTLERRVVEAPSINGGYEVVLEVEEETIRIDSENSRLVRREFNSDPDGDRRLVRTTEEGRIERPDGSRAVLRSLSESDINGRLQPIQRETERSVQSSPGVYETEVEVSVPGLYGGRFVPIERTDYVERRDAANRILELDETTYSSPVGGRGWFPVERRQINYTYADEEILSAEQVYRPDSSGNLSLSDRHVKRTWVDTDGNQKSSEETYARNIPGLSRFSEPRLYRQIDTLMETGPDGTAETVQEVREFQVDRLRLVERVIERSRPDGRGGVVTEREVQAADANGRLRTMSVSTQTESE